MKDTGIEKGERPVTWGRMTMCEVMESPRGSCKPREELEGSVPATPPGPEPETEETEPDRGRTTFPSILKKVGNGQEVSQFSALLRRGFIAAS